MKRESRQQEFIKILQRSCLIVSGNTIAPGPSLMAKSEECPEIGESGEPQSALKRAISEELTTCTKRPTSWHSG